LSKEEKKLIIVKDKASAVEWTVKGGPYEVVDIREKKAKKP